MIIADALSAAVLLSVVLTSSLGALTAGHLVAAALVTAGLGVFFDAGAYGLLPAVVGREHIAVANSALYAAATAVRIAGTATAGVLIAVLGPAGALAVDAVSFAASALLLRAVSHASRHRPAAGRRAALGESIRQGLCFLVRHPVLRIMTVVGLLQSFSGGAVVGQFVVYADRALGLPADDLRVGLLYAAWAVGGIGGSLVLPLALRRTDATRFLLVALPLGTGLGLGVVLSRYWALALVTVAAWGTVYLSVLVNTLNHTQAVTPAPLQGRVNTTRRMLSSGLGVPLGAMLAGAVTTQWGVRWGMSTAVLAAAAAAALVWGLRLTGRLPRDTDDRGRP
ncbi:MAG: MFS transporter [Kineosporiaceae bacterium]